MQAGERIDLHEAGLAFAVQANVGASAVAAVQRAVRPQRECLHLLAQRAGARRLVPDELLAQLLRLERVDVPMRRIENQDLHRPDGPRLPPVAKEPDREFPARQELLHEDRLGVAGQKLGADLPQGCRSVCAGSGSDALSGAFGQGLGEHGIGQTNGVDVGRGADDVESRSPEPGFQHDALGHALVERDGAGVGVRERVRDPVEFEQTRHLRFPEQPPHSFRDIEHEFPAITRRKPLAQRSRMADAIRGVAEGPDRRLQGGQGFVRVELGDVLLAVALGKVLAPQVVCEADFQRRLRSAAAA